MVENHVTGVIIEVGKFLLIGRSTEWRDGYIAL